MSDCAIKTVKFGILWFENIVFALEHKRRRKKDGKRVPSVHSAMSNITVPQSDTISRHLLESGY